MRIKFICAMMAVVLVSASPILAQTAADFGGVNGGSVRVGIDTATCVSAKDGALRFTSATDSWEFCDGSAWIPFEHAGSVASATEPAISAGPYHTCAVRSDNAGVCWGTAALGRLGNGTTTPNVTAPVLVSGGHSWKTISAEENGSCGVRTDGVAMCWGAALNGRLGNGTTTPNVTAPVIVNGGHSWKTVSAGYTHSCGIRTDGVAMCWGSAANGELGNGLTTPDQTAPVVVSGGYTWQTISTDSNHTCGVRTDGVAMCWGQAFQGALGNGTTTPNQTAPVVVNGGYSWKMISAATNYTCGVRTDNVAMCWGADNFGQLGNGAGGAQTAPAIVSGGHSWSRVDTGGLHTCGIRTDGVAMCWGYAGNGRLGNGTTTPDVTVPVTVNGSYSWTTISNSGNHNCGIRTNGVAMCWGPASGGKLGNGTTTPDQTAPVLVNAGTGHPHVSGGEQSQ